MDFLFRCRASEEKLHCCCGGARAIVHLSGVNAHGGSHVKLSVVIAKKAAQSHERVAKHAADQLEDTGTVSAPLTSEWVP